MDEGGFHTPSESSKLFFFSKRLNCGLYSDRSVMCAGRGNRFDFRLAISWGGRGDIGVDGRSMIEVDGPFSRCGNK